MLAEDISEAPDTELEYLEDLWDALNPSDSEDELMTGIGARRRISQR